MSFCLSGLDAPCAGQPVTIAVSPTHPLIQLAQVIPWAALVELVLPDLKQSTAKGKWWLGRKLKLRIHLGAFLLQWLYNLTDRQVEWGLTDNAAYQLFCGEGSVEKWQVPDHTKLEEFRSRLSPETQRRLANEVAVWATALGFADPSKMDIDLQELIYSGAAVLSEEALKKGLVNELVEPTQLMDRARSVAQRFIEIPAPLFALTKRQIRQPSKERDPSAIKDFAARFAQLWADPATHAAIRAYAERTFKQL